MVARRSKPARGGTSSTGAKAPRTPRTRKGKWSK